jgi:hypothetical protein
MLIVCRLRRPTNSNYDPRNDGNTVQELHFEQDADQYKLFPGHPSVMGSPGSIFNWPKKPQRESDDAASGSRWSAIFPVSANALLMAMVSYLSWRERVHDACDGEYRR